MTAPRPSGVLGGATKAAPWIVVVFAGCTSTVRVPGPEQSAAPPPDDLGVVEVTEPAASPAALTLTGEQAERYLERLAPMLAGRVLSPAERARARAEHEAAIPSILASWTDAPYLAEVARLLIQNELQVSGQAHGIDFDLPGNLAHWVVQHDLPYATLLTADHCVSAAGSIIPCDTGAPFAAGVLATRAYLKSRASRFNLTRASNMMLSFACARYPIDEAVEPYIERERLIPMFRALSVDDQEDAGAVAGFGNGSACFTCHGQFGKHAQLFVRFDEEGRWRADATGLQDAAAGAELGRSSGGLYASHLADPREAASERSNVMGHEVQNLAEAAQVIAASPQFTLCASRNLLELVLGLDGAAKVDRDMLVRIAAVALQEDPEPSFAVIARETFAYHRVIRSVLAAIGMPVVEEVMP